MMFQMVIIMQANRKTRIDNFFKELRNDYLSSGSYDVNDRDIYKRLCFYGLISGEEKISYRKYFEEWKQYFDSKPSACPSYVYDHFLQPGFIQFDNISSKSYDYDVIKLYVNIDPRFINDTVKLIHDFIIEHGIEEHSKVADHARSDAIVLRIAGIEDANKVIDFINSNETIIRNSRPLNPFLMTSGIVGVSFDDCLSYNITLANLIAEYVNVSGLDDGLSYDKFGEYISFLINEYFTSLEGIKSFIADSPIFKGNFEHTKSCHSNLSDVEVRDYVVYNAFAVMLQIKEACYLNDKNIIMQMRRDYDAGDKTLDIKYFQRMIDKYNKPVENALSQTKEQTLNYEKDTSEFFHTVQEYVLYTFYSKKDYLQAFPKFEDRKAYITSKLEEYFLTGKTSQITRDNKYGEVGTDGSDKDREGFRSRFIKLNRNVITDHKLTAANFVNGVIKDYEYEQSNNSAKNKYMDQTVRHPIVEDVNLALILHGNRDYLDKRKLQAVRNVYRKVFPPLFQQSRENPYSKRNVALWLSYKQSKNEERLLDYDASSEIYKEEYDLAISKLINAVTRGNVKQIDTKRELYDEIEREYENIERIEMMVVDPSVVLNTYVRYLCYHGYSTDEIVYSLLEISQGNYTNVTNYIGLQDSIKRIRPDKIDEYIGRESSNKYDDYESYVVNAIYGVKGIIRK